MCEGVAQGRRGSWNEVPRRWESVGDERADGVHDFINKTHLEHYIKVGQIK